MSHVLPDVHEAKGFLYYSPIEPNTTDWEGLDPYWALTRFLTDVDGYLELDDVEINGELWDIRLNYHRGSIAPRPDDPIDTDEGLYEFDITVHGQGHTRGGSYQIRPRYPDLQTVDGDSIPTTFQHVADEGVSVQFQVSGMQLYEIRDLFPRFLQELFQAEDQDLYHGYFSRPVGGHINELERYVRIHRNMAKKVLQSGGQFHKLAIHMSGVEGVHGTYDFDNTEEMGYIHQFRYNQAGANDMVPTHKYGKQIKGYLPENPDAFDEDDALYHHKFGALYRTTLNNDNSIRWEDRHELVDELDEALLNVLSWAGVPIEAGGTTFISDDYFAAGAERDENVPIYEDPAPALEAEQETLLLRTLRDLSERTRSDVEVLQTLATDGGQHVRELADETEYGVSTIYRAIERLGDAVEVQNGHVEFMSQKIAEEVRAIADEISDVVESGAKRASNLVQREIRGSASSAFDKFLAKYGAEFERPDDGDGKPVVRIDTVLSWFKRSSRPRVEAVVDELLQAWHQDGYDVQEIGDARIVAELADGDRLDKEVRTLR
ncbi:DUF7845 domain-containing protein [Halorhabdus salina]|uniref:DUF7845 domain-containing protein n=1 Tax=Halorhabdus salina TaxID=2750670 RepID=UPI0015EF82A4|nr:hypothetical protein [Halorhabdus salina]